MPKPGKAAESHRSKHVVDMGNDVPPPEWVAVREASSGEWDERDRFPYPIDSDKWEAQVFQRTRRDPQSGRLVDFGIGVQVRPLGSDEGWIDIERVDCADGGVHVDRTTAAGTESKDFDCVPTDCRDNLEKAYGWATEYCWDVDARMKGWL